MLQHFKFKLPVSSNLIPSLIRHYVMVFYNSLYRGYNRINGSNTHLLVMVKVISNNGETRTLAPLRKLNHDDEHLFSQYLITIPKN